jgi:hypothetical protein
VNLEQSLSSLF